MTRVINISLLFPLRVGSLSLHDYLGCKHFLYIIFFKYFMKKTSNNSLSIFYTDQNIYIFIYICICIYILKKDIT